MTLENDQNIACPSRVSTERSPDGESGSRRRDDADDVTPLPLWHVPPGLVETPTLEALASGGGVLYVCFCHR